MTEMTETEIIIYFMAFFFGFIWGGLFFYELGERRANQKNIEFWNGKKWLPPSTLISTELSCLRLLL